VGKIPNGWEQWLLLVSDQHHDNQFCDRKLEREHLDLALERNALILSFGDTFCAMQGKYDPRKSQEALRPEDRGDNYLNLIVDHAAEDYSKYAANWLLLGQGNHEYNIVNRHGFDLLSALAQQMRRNDGCRVEAGGVQGWVRIIGKYGTRPFQIKLRYHHGAGGTDAPVTRGVIQTNRQSVYLPDADIVCNGHNHEAYALPVKRERISNKGTPYYDCVHFVRTPGYLSVYSTNQWNDQKMQSPKPVGCIWARLYHAHPYADNRHDVMIQTSYDVR
jgi:hypothetical protein